MEGGKVIITLTPQLLFSTASATECAQPPYELLEIDGTASTKHAKIRGRRETDEDGILFIEDRYHS